MVVNELSNATYTAKAAATQGVGTSFWPSSTGFDTNIVAEAASFAVHYVDAGAGTATVDVSIEVSNDGTNWQTDTVTAFTQVTTVAKRYVKGLTANGLWGKFVRCKMVVGTATSGVNSLQFVFKGQPGAFLP